LLHIVSGQTGVFRNTRKHARTNLLAVVKREHKIGPAWSLQRAVRSALSFNRPADPQQRRKYAAPSRRASGSCELEQAGKFVRERFAILDPFGDHPQCERRGLRAGFRIRRPVTEHARQRRNFRQPATTILAFGFNAQHGDKLL
jgi:hypothetical protein